MVVCRRRFLRSPSLPPFAAHWSSTISQRFAVVMQDADSAEMRDDDGHNDGYVFVTSHSPEDAIQQMQQIIKKMTPASGGK